MTRQDSMLPLLTNPSKDPATTSSDPADGLQSGQFFQAAIHQYAYVCII